MNDDPGFVAIVGAGQVGTMLGMALRGARGVRGVALFDRVPRAVDDSLARGGGDRALSGLEEAVTAHTVVLAVPVPAVVGLTEELAPQMRPGSLLIDTGSSKAVVVETMRRAVPDGVLAVGGHPLAGTERPGPGGADPERLKGAPFVLTPARDDPAAMARARAFVEAVGALPVEMDAAAHDRAIARTSHLSHVAAFALGLLAAREARDIASLVSTGFRGATRLAASDPSMVAGFLSANAKEVRLAIEELRGLLSDIGAAIGDGPTPTTDLTSLLEAARAAVLELTGERG